MENQMSLFCKDEKDHNFEIVSHSCELEIEKFEDGQRFTGKSTLVLLCKNCGKEDIREEWSESKQVFYIE